MGCSASKLDDEEAVQLCKDRKNFIKQVIEHRNRFASGHVAYIQSMRRVSLALLHYVVADDLHEFLSDSYATPPFTPVKRLSPEIRAPLKFSTPTSNDTVKSSVCTVNYLRSGGGNQSVAVEEWPETHETVQLEFYYPTENYGTDDSFVTQSSPVNRSSFFSSPYNRSGYQSSSPRASGWDYFWNPFSSLGQYEYPSRNSFDRVVNDDDVAELRQVREAEGIPELEEDIDDDHNHDRDHDRRNLVFWKTEPKTKTPEVECMQTGVQVGDESPVSASAEVQNVQEVKELKKSIGSQSIEASEDQNVVELEIPNQNQVTGTSNAEETPGFTVYVNRRPASMAEVMKDMDNQFMRICDCAHEISVMLEASRTHYSSASNELAGKIIKKKYGIYYGMSYSSYKKMQK